MNGPLELHNYSLQKSVCLFAYLISILASAGHKFSIWFLTSQIQFAYLFNRSKVLLAIFRLGFGTFNAN